MTKRKTGPRRRGGRTRVLNDVQVVALLLLAAQYRELGPMRTSVQAAKVAWRAKRAEIGSIKSWAAKFGVSKGTISEYIHGGHKWDLGSNGYSATSLRARANGIASAVGMGNPVPGVIQDATSALSAKSINEPLCPSVRTA